jgi:hypothetical protein
LLPADAGEARVAGYDVRREADQVRASIGVTGQFSAVDELLTGRENLRLMADLGHLDRRSAETGVERLLERYLTLGQALDRTDDGPRLVELADKPAAYLTQMADEEGEDYVDDAHIEPPFVRLMDTLVFETVPPARQLIELLKKRGWTGWTKLERVDPTRGAAGTRQVDTAMQRSRCEW